jgi:hypothetical protein|tara:strand:+ start:511 stop:1146 length:636 start_codon:yes stop_codon:yes gene_type:complete
MLLDEIKEYCEGRRIILVGNSSGILNTESGIFIDSYDIVVRMNRGYFHRKHHVYSSKIGSKTNILSLGIKSATMSANIIQSNTVDYILSPIMYSEGLGYSNAYHIEDEVYQTLKAELGGFKPSTGISTYNFFNRFVNFERLDLIGFDFFKSSVRSRNQLGHCYVQDHHGVKEFKFFERSKDPEKTQLHNTPAPSTVPINNIPNYTIKNIKR